MTEFPCKYGCGIFLHYDNGHVVDGSNAHHDCPNAPWKQDSNNLSAVVKLLERQTLHLARIADALEYLARK